MSIETATNTDTVKGITFLHDSAVSLVETTPGAEEVFINAARISTLGRRLPPGKELSTHDKGLLNMLIRDRHGSCFEHYYFTFSIHTPLFVAREIMRHRIASYNEVSGRYTELDGAFYILPEDRPTIQVGKPAAYTYILDDDRRDHTNIVLKNHSAKAWTAYRDLLSRGIAKEVARMVLPLNLFTSIQVTLNVRSLTNFLTLRIDHQNNLFPSFAMFEIQRVAEKMENYLKRKLPVFYGIWSSDKTRRIAL